MLTVSPATVDRNEIGPQRNQISFYDIFVAEDISFARLNASRTCKSRQLSLVFCGSPEVNNYAFQSASCLASNLKR